MFKSIKQSLFILALVVGVFGFTAFQAQASGAPGICAGASDWHTDSVSGVTFCILESSFASNMCTSIGGSEVLVQKVGIINNSSYNGYIRSAGFTDTVAGCGATDSFPAASGFSVSGGNIAASQSGIVTFTFSAGAHEQCGRVQLDASFRGDGCGDLDRDGYNILGKVVNYGRSCSAPAQPPTADIKANNSDGPVTIGYNASANLTWTSQNATACTVTPGNYTGTSGSQSTGNLTASRTYAVTCTGPGGTATDSVTVNVQAAGVCRLQISKTVDRTQAAPGDTVTYTLNFKNIGTANCTGGGVRVEDVADANLTYLSETHSSNIDAGYNGKPVWETATRLVRWNAHTLVPGQSGWATWTARISNGAVTNGSSCSASPSLDVANTARITSYEYSNFSQYEVSNTVHTAVSTPCQTPTADIKANNSDGPVTIGYNASANLTWTSQNATACTVTPGNYTGTSGSQSTGNLTASRTYAVTCTGPGGTATDSVTVNVQAPLLSADIKANNSDGPVTIDHNTSANLTWTSSGATQCTVTPGNHTGISGSQSTGNLTATQAYVLNCTGLGGSVSDSVTVNVRNAAVSADIKANNSDGPISVAYNTSAALTWTSSGATACTVTPGNYTGVTGSQSTGDLIATQVYLLTCTGPGGTATDSVTVNVSSQNITADIKANNSDGPITIDYNSSAVIAWTSSGATACTVAPDNYTGTSGSQSTGNLTATRTYVLTCSNGSRVATDSVTVNVNTQQVVSPTVTISANPSSIYQGSNSLLTWTSQNATQCTAAGGWSGVKAVSGSETVAPANTATYVIVCTNSTGQSAFAQATVTVTGSSYQTPTLTLYSNPTVINQGQSSVLNWNSQNTVSCTANSGNWSGNKMLSGSEVVYPPYTTTYGMTCIGTNGQTVTAQATIVVNNNSQYGNPPTVNLSVYPSTITQGQAATLNWYSNNANTCSVSNGWSGNRNLTGSETVSPSYTTSYTITCINNYGIASDVETITVSNYNQATNVQVTKSVRNVTLNQSSFSNTVDAEGLDTLEFEIRVRNNDPYNTMSNVIVRDLLPQELYLSAGTTNVDGASVGEGVTGSGITLNALSPNQERVVRFRTVVFYGAAQKTVVNQAIATAGSGSVQSGFANINIRPRGQVLGVADIVTGPEDAVPWILVIGFFATLFVQMVFFKKSGPFAADGVTLTLQTSGQPFELTRIPNDVAPVSTPARVRYRSAKDELEARLAELRAQEERPDTERLMSAS